MSEMVERVAMAIANTGSGGVDNWSLHPGAVQDSWRAEARAAIEAMRPYLDVSKIREDDVA